MSAPQATPSDLDIIAAAAISAYYGRLDLSQVNKFLELLYSQDLETAKAFLARQVARRYWDQGSAELLFSLLKGSREEVAKKIGLFKWLVEGLTRGRRVQNLPRQVQPTQGLFEKLVQAIITGRWS